MSDYEIKPTLIKTDEKRTIIVVGKTGAGKSLFLNNLIGEKIFIPSADTLSCTDKVEPSEWRRVISRLDETKEISYELKAFDTPGLGDSGGKSIEYLNEIAQAIKTTPLNLIIILVDYGRFDTSLHGYLEVLSECLNEMTQSSSMLIINKVPTENSLNKRRKRGERVRERKEVLEETFEKISLALGNSFKYRYFLENDESDDADPYNTKQCNQIRQIIFSCSSQISSTKVKTWDEIEKFYSGEIVDLTDQEVIIQMNNLIAEKQDRLDKVEFDIADIKYPFLDYIKCLNADEESIDGKIFSSLFSLKSFVSDFECQLTENEYNQKKNSSSYYKMIRDQILNRITPDNAMKTIGAAAHVATELNLAVPTLAAAIAEITPLVIGITALVGVASIGFTASMYYFYQNNKSINQNLTKLDIRRGELKKELRECQGSIDAQKKMLEEKKAKIIRLKSVLVNPNQQQP